MVRTNEKVGFNFVAMFDVINVPFVLIYRVTMSKYHRIMKPSILNSIFSSKMKNTYKDPWIWSYRRREHEIMSEIFLMILSHIFIIITHTHTHTHKHKHFILNTWQWNWSLVFHYSSQAETGQFEIKFTLITNNLALNNLKLSSAIDC